MVKLIIDGNQVEVKEGTTILEAARANGIMIPSLCYQKGLNEIGACRVCVVEIKGMDRLVASCNTVVEEGIEVFTNSPKVRTARITNVKLILSQHDCNCAYCLRSGNCALQEVANSLGLKKIDYKVDLPRPRKLDHFPLVRIEEKCIKCMRCIQVCDKVQDIGIWDVANTGSRTTVGVSGNRELTTSECVACGQCVTHCPTGALTARDDTRKVFEYLADPEIITVVQIAPAVRAAWGESFGMTREKATVKRLVAALKKVGFNYVFDTDFSADLTIMEEGTEFIERYTHRGDDKSPMFTSCCPGWVRYIKSQYPDMVHMLSSAKSPQQMFGAVTKTYFAKKIGVDPAKIRCISIMPCMAKKAECEYPTMDSTGTGPDVDIVITTREADRIIAADHINPIYLEEEEFDTPLGEGTGAAVIFGVTGGVMEAALRSAYFLLTKKNPDPDAFKAVRGCDGWKEAEFDLAGIPLKVAVASGLANTRKLMEAIRTGKKQYDFVEIMACPGGCTGGGGQPIHEGEELACLRGDNLYGLDKHSDIRFSHENQSVQTLYKEFFEKPNSHLAHELLHTDHEGWEMPKACKRHK
ncbi:MAG: [FeFe] hydrogenase, group A [Lachnospiraceae bacterium]|jgi:NADH-quinone oxidoreductase subunit G|nr:[FeFe] hydrogenase, group A [Lachnospiraceae bacterium]